MMAAVVGVVVLVVTGDLTFSLLLGNDGWLLGKRLADRRIGGWIGCCWERERERKEER